LNNNLKQKNIRYMYNKHNIFC